MEASVSQDGTQTTEGQDGTQAASEATPAPQTAQLPPEVMERLNELGGFREELQPLLQNLQPQPQAQEGEEQGYEDFVDPETGYVLDPQGLEQYMQQKIQEGIQEGTSPLQSRLDQIDQRFTQEAFEDLKHEFPQLGEEKFQAAFVPRVEQAAAQLAQSMGLSPDHARQIALSPQFVRTQLLAGMAWEQAQQGVPAGDQGVHIEGGTGAPGQPEPDAKQEWLKGMPLGAQSGPFGRPLDDF